MPWAHVPGDPMTAPGRLGSGQRIMAAGAAQQRQGHGEGQQLEHRVGRQAPGPETDAYREGHAGEEGAASGPRFPSASRRRQRCSACSAVGWGRGLPSNAAIGRQPRLLISRAP